MRSNAFLALGSNISDREAHLIKAVDALRAHHAIQVKRVSSLYETEPVGYIDQSAFINMVVQIETELNPVELLDVTQAIEVEVGRKQTFRNGPRIVDLDILLYEQENIELNELQIPHPRMWDRAFVLIPLAEISPEIYSTRHRQTLRELLTGELINKEGVEWWKEWNGAGAYVRTEN
ncbi:2-amino-4-hydroxy-6-hydroxymethyldihydropteridine diphosphokinase [Alkalihalobacillus xiaoxiensis]|uniref:2-amino-4-hydroxy-6-hydroxymethyldihydropteridine diphosphokinase n=1 Tax=Shouchella xiaoxiensis TaxID=766895 RepID=A0ABS2T1D3_9BACI|nr:2-amino-4-hydroxy-6-hydroxymethyldihydropteridine diphosphokinase [Shouchella xiaoxiensis]MBM7841310.1 2-amino-4-hydroxy-6-hydroxymethyldihydropteridine diphosphokinase [Shouchella xiaoxiensis]